MKKAVALTALATALWLLGGTWYYDCKIKQVCGPGAATEATTATRAAIAPADATATLPAAPLRNKPARVSSPDMRTATGKSASPTAATAAAAGGLTVYFGRKSTELVVPPEARAALPALLDAARKGHKIRVIGHSDGRGKPELKAELSAQRALILRDWLLAQGLAESQIASIESHEDHEPVADNATSEGRARNRRAEARVVP